MERRIVDGEITLVPYYPNYKASKRRFRGIRMRMCASRSTTATVCTT